MDSPITPQLLTEHLKQGAAARESTLARFISLASGCCVFSSLCFGPLIGWAHAGSVAAMSAGYCLYYAWVHHRLKHTAPSPALIWLNAGLENSIVGFMFLLDVHFGGPEQALANPISIIAATAIVASALRSDTRLPLFAAGIAAVELLLLYAFLAYPRLPRPVPLMLSPPLILLRALYFVLTGWLAQLTARQLRGLAEEALRAIRQQELLGRYFLHERLGSGGMAEVFRATYSPEGGIERTVALKRILPAYAEDAQFIALFRREAELGSLLQHPNIVQVLDVGRLGDTHFIAMEFVDGLSLRQLLEEHGRLPPSAVAYIGAEISAALDYAHRRTSPDGAPLNLIHRDINPPNILLSRLGDVKLGDFGIARAVSYVSITRLGSIRGKSDYMAPEQLQGGPLDGRTDLFALGLTLHEALTGQRVLKEPAETPEALLAVLRELPLPSALCPEVPPELDAAIMALLQPRPEDRPERGSHVEGRLRALPRAVAPSPQGQAALAHAIRAVLARRTGSITTPASRSISSRPAEGGPGWESTPTVRVRPDQGS